MATILVTGGAGYIGSVATSSLIEAGHEVIIIDNLSKGKRELVHQKATFYELDTTDRKVATVFARHQFDAVIHFAAYKAVGESMQDAPKYSSNITGLINILNNMVASKVKKIIFSSTAAVYGEPQYSPVDEKHPTDPQSFYGATKLEAERIMQWYEKIHNITTISLRYFNVVGDVLGYIDPAAENVLPIIMEVACGKREFLEIFGDDYDTRDGTGVRDYVDVQDLVDAHIAALTLKKSKIINLGTQKGTSVKELLLITEEVVGKKIPCKISERRKGDVATVVASNKLAKELLEWKPKVSLKKSVKKTWKAYN